MAVRGPAGTPGLPGVQGPPGASSSAYAYSWSNTSTPPPTSGQVRSDGATPDVSATLWLNYRVANGDNVAPLLRMITAGDSITIQDRTDATKYAEYAVAADAVDYPGGSYVEVPVVYTGGTGVGKSNQSITLFHQMVGPAGPAGGKGDPGTPGAPGAAATVAVGSTTTGTPGSNAAVTNTGTSSAAVLAFTIPKGDKGDPGTPGTPGTPGAAATVTVGTTATGTPGSNAAVTNSGTSSAAVLAFTIPQGQQGIPGVQGDPGPQGPSGTPAVAYQQYYVSGRYYDSRVTNGATTTTTNAVNRLYLTPTVIYAPVTIAGLFINVTAVSTGGFGRVGVWNVNPATGTPGTLVYGSAQFSTTALGLAGVTGLSLALPAGQYFFGYVPQTSAPTVSALNGGNVFAGYRGTTNWSTTGQASMEIADSVTGALPSNPVLSGISPTLTSAIVIIFQVA
jgi:hypothetical protein